MGKTTLAGNTPAPSGWWKEEKGDDQDTRSNSASC